MPERISVKEFRRFGYLQELNRQFLHPLGLALEVIIDEEGNETLGGVWDCQDDPTGFRFGFMELDIEKIQRVAELQEKKAVYRRALLGYVIQEPLVWKLT